jgi:hypothetical protein
VSERFWEAAWRYAWYLYVPASAWPKVAVMPEWVWGIHLIPYSWFEKIADRYERAYDKRVH